MEDFNVEEFFEKLNTMPLSHQIKEFNAVAVEKEKRHKMMVSPFCKKWTKQEKILQIMTYGDIKKITQELLSDEELENELLMNNLLGVYNPEHLVTRKITETLKELNK